MCPASCFGASDGVASRILELGMAAGAKECARELIFRPLGLFGIPLFPRLTPWAAIFRRFAAGSGHQLFHRIAKYLVLRHTLRPDKLEVLDAVLKCPPFPRRSSTALFYDTLTIVEIFTSVLDPPWAVEWEASGSMRVSTFAGGGARATSVWIEHGRITFDGRAEADSSLCSE